MQQALGCSWMSIDAYIYVHIYVHASCNWPCPVVQLPHDGEGSTLYKGGLEIIVILHVQLLIRRPAEPQPILLSARQTTLSDQSIFRLQQLRRKQEHFPVVYVHVDR
jgi:hypothetical protein